MRQLEPVVLMTILCLAYGLTACSSPTPTGPIYRRAPPPPSEKIRIYLYRQDALRGVGPIAVEIDDHPLGKLGDGEYRTLLLEPGTHAMDVRLDWFGLVPRSWNEIQFVGESGQTLYLRVWADYANLRNPESGTTNASLSEFRADAALFLSQRRAEEAIPDLKRASLRSGR